MNLTINEKLQQIQEVYSSFIGMPVFIVDSEGNQITEISAKKFLHNIPLHYHQVVYHQVKEKIIRLKTSYIDKPFLTEIVLCEEIPAQGILMPVHLKMKQDLYIFAGIFMMDINRHAQRDKDTHSSYRDLIKEIPVLSNDLLYEKMDIIKNFSSICSDIIYRYHVDERIKEISEKLINYSSSDQILSVFKMIDSNIDFLVYAKQKKKNFVVELFIGEKSVSLYGLTIPTNQSFIEECLVSGMPAYWEGVRFDSRTSIFTERGINPLSIFAYPIKHKGEIKGFIIGGSEKVSVFYKEFMTYCNVIGQIYELDFQNKYVNSKRDQQLMKLSALIDICKSMGDLESTEELSYIVFDLIYSIFKTNFASMMYMNGKSNHRTFANRKSEIKLENYLSEVFNKYFLNQLEQPVTSIKRVKYHEGTIIECPIKYQNDMLAVLSIEVNESMDKEFEVCLSVLLSYIEISLFALFNKQADKHIQSDSKRNNHKSISKAFFTQLTEREKEIVGLVIQGQSNQAIAAQIYISDSTVKNHLTNVYKKLGVKNRNELLALNYQLNVSLNKRLS